MDDETDMTFEFVAQVRKRVLIRLKKQLEDADIDMAEPNLAFEYKDGWNDSLNSTLDYLDKLIKECG